MTVDPKVRYARISDAQALVHYYQEIASESDFLSFGVGEITKTLDDQQRFIKNGIENENCMVSVAELNSQIIGMLNIHAVQKPRLWHNGEMGISVRKAFWGNGVGKKLLDFMFEWAIQNKIIKKINLTVVSNNHKAIKLYENYGFKKEGELINDFYLNGMYFNGILMGRWLG